MKNLIKVLVILLFTISFSGCSTKGLSSGKFSEEQLKNKLEETIASFNKKDFDSIYDSLVKELSGEDTKKILSQAWDILLTGAGEYKGMKKMSFQESNGIGIVVAVSAYEKRNVKYTLKVNENMEVVEFWCK